MHAKHAYQSGRVGLETFPRGIAPPRHRHREGYASVVLAGAFVEAGFGGRVRVEPGWMIGSKVISGSLTLTSSRDLPNRIPASPWSLSRGPASWVCGPRLCRVDSGANSVCRQSNFDSRHEPGAHGLKSCDRLEHLQPLHMGGQIVLTAKPSRSPTATRAR